MPQSKTVEILLIFWQLQIHGHTLEQNSVFVQILRDTEVLRHKISEPPKSWDTEILRHSETTTFEK